jgi:hypothetical protein
MNEAFARILAARLAVPLGLAIAWATPAFAQFDNGGPAGISGASQRTLRASGQDAASKPQVAPPPVLPGTKVAPEAAEPTLTPADMSPTDALFDAINRGDLAAARDAMNRGADLHGQNVLGLTPLEQSVDLGRNDISFMLLSMREGDATSRAAAQRGTDQRGGDLKGANAQRGAVPQAGAAPRAPGRARATAVSVRAPEEPVAEAPRLYSGNGGAPIPDAGFLGFDGGRAVR